MVLVIILRKERPSFGPIICFRNCVRLFSGLRRFLWMLGIALSQSYKGRHNDLPFFIKTVMENNISCLVADPVPVTLLLCYSLEVDYFASISPAA